MIQDLQPLEFSFGMIFTIHDDQLLGEVKKIKHDEENNNKREKSITLALL